MQATSCIVLQLRPFATLYQILLELGIGQILKVELIGLTRDIDVIGKNLQSPRTNE
jgi:hypothetical protein